VQCRLSTTGEGPTAPIISTTAEFSFSPAAARLPRAANKLPSNRPLLRSGPPGAGRSPVVAVTAIEAAMGGSNLDKGHDHDCYIGIFEKLNDGMSGTIATVTINARVRFVPVLSAETTNAPSFRIFTEKIEVGAAWKKTSATSGRE
jgi:hypothetical protein